MNADIRPAKSSLHMFDNSHLKTAGMITLAVQHPKTKYTEELDFYVATAHNQPLIGWEACLAFDLLSLHNDNICAVNTAAPNNHITHEMIATKYADLFEGYGKLSGEVHLQVDESVPPVRMPLRKLPVVIKEKVRAELEMLQREGIIAPVAEPTPWISALLVVAKPDGRVRICIDPKPLNKALMRDHYPMPTIDDVLPKLAEAKVFSSVDASNAFWHLCLDEESSKLTTFETPFGKFRWLRLPYGVSPAPELFQRRIHEALSGLKGVACIADDMLVYGCGDTLEEAQQDHDRCLTELLDRCREKRIRLNKGKMKINLSSVKFMGYELTQDGLKADKQKTEAIASMPPPTDRQRRDATTWYGDILSPFCSNFFGHSGTDS